MAAIDDLIFQIDNPVLKAKSQPMARNERWFANQEFLQC